MGAVLPGHPARAQPHEGNCEKMSSSLHGCLGATNQIPVHGWGTTLPSPRKVQNASDRNVRRNERSCRPLIGRFVLCKMCTPMCASAHVVSSNIVYLSIDIDPRGEVR